MPIRTVIKARALRQRSTRAEHLLWRKLRNRGLQGYKFRRQEPIGRFIVDFFCHEHRLIIELDGDVHVLKVASDREREAWLRAQGYSVLRFPNGWIYESMGFVLDKILEEIARISFVNLRSGGGAGGEG